MHKIPDRLDKYLRLVVHQRGLCGCGCGEYMRHPVDLHHMLHDTKGNRENFPLFLNSLCNLKAIKHDHHINRPVPGITPHEAEKYEAFFQRHPALYNAVK